MEDIVRFFLNNIHSVEKTNVPPSHQSAEVFPGVRQAVHALGVPVVEEELVFVEQGEGFLHRADGGVDANLRLPNLKQWNSEGMMIELLSPNRRRGWIITEINTRAEWAGKKVTFTEVH